MLKGVKAKIGIIVVGILVLCGAVLGIINAFADPNYPIIYAQTDLYSWQDSGENIIELDSTNGSDFSVTLSLEEYYSIVRNIEGYFTPNEGSYITADSCSKVVSESVCNVSNGHFSLTNESDNSYYNIYTIHYTVSPDTPAGVYELPIHTDAYLAQNGDDYIDLDAGYNSTTDLEVTVKRPQEVIFKDTNGNPITEITKYYGDEDFIINKYASDGEIIDYYVDGDESVADIVDGTDYIHVGEVGSVNICALAEETDLYIENESCFTVNVKKRPILTYNLSVLHGDNDENFENGPAIVELNGVDDAEVAVSLKSIDTIRMLNAHGTFATSEDPYNEYGSRYIRATDFYSMSICGEQCGFNINSGYFYYEYNDIDVDGNWFGENEDVAKMVYTISADTPAGVYNLPISVLDLQGRNMDNETDFDEENIYFENVQIMVRRPQNIVFRDHDENPITEVNKTYGDPDFKITKEVYDGEGAGEIIDYFVAYSSSVNESEGDIVEIVPDSDYIHINKAGSAEICAAASETELYLETVACYTVNVGTKEIWVKDLSITDKQFDGDINAEIDELTFYTLDSEGHQIDIDIDPTNYYIDRIELDDVNVGETTANIEIHLTGEGAGRYYLAEGMYTVPATISQAYLQTFRNITVDSQEYDAGNNCQHVPIYIEAILDEESDLGIELHEGIDFNLFYMGEELYNETCLTEVGDYNLTVYPNATSNLTFDPFDVTFTITPKEITVTNADVNDKNIDWEYEATVNWVEFDQADLTKDVDYTAYAVLNGIDVGAWNATVYVTLLNTNYCFGHNEDSDTYSYQTTYEVSGVQISPRELTNGNTYYSFENDQNRFTYTGYPIKPHVYLSASLKDDDSPEDYQPLSLGTDYTLEYSEDTTNAEMKYVTLAGIGNFCGVIGPLNYYIDPYIFEDVNISTPSVIYSGEAFEPEPVLTAMFYENEITIPKDEYEVMQHEDFVNAGEYTYYISDTGGGNYRFQNYNVLDATLTINPYKISSSNISLSESTYKYNGTSQTPSVTVTVGDTTIDGDDYNVVYSADTIGNDESDTTVTVTITAKEGANITGSASTTYTITPRDMITIAGIEDNQQIGYTGSPVALDGNVMVEENEGGITAEDLIITWYASDGTTVIDQPTNAGSYKVVYSYEDADYRGALVINFEITKADSPTPAEMETDFRTTSGQTLANLEGERTVGFTWVDNSTTVAPGNNVYPATYTYNNDPVNYETLNLNVPVYGLTQVDVITPESEGGKISASSQNVLEGETVTITITPDFGYVLSSITVNGINYIGNVEGNTLLVVAETSDLEIVATFVPITYRVIEGAGQVYIIDEDSEAEFKIDADYELFKNGGAVYVDDLLVDPTNYTSWDGSTYIKFTDEYLSTIAIGAHTLKVTFNDGGTATTTFTIAESEGVLATPNTGVFAMIGGGATATVGALAVILVVFMIVQRTIWKR